MAERSDPDARVQRRRRADSSTAVADRQGAASATGPGGTTGDAAGTSPKARSSSKARAGSNARASSKARSGDTAGSSSQDGAQPRSPRMARLAVHPSSNGPKVRLGILWFILALAAVTAGRWWTAILWGAVAALASRELLGAWWSADRKDRGDAVDGPAIGVVAISIVLTLAVPAAAALGTGFVGGVLLLVVAALAAVIAVARTGSIALDATQASALAVAVLLPAMTAAAVVLVVASHLWAGMFLVIAVSLYDAGCFVGGADSSSLLEGPVTGTIGVLAVAFTMAMFQPPPFDTATAVVVGGLSVLACPAGQWVASAFLPSVDSPCRAVRRLDTYVLTAPLFLGACWYLG